MTTSLKVTKLIRAPRPKVYAAWITPEVMDQWFVPKGMTLVESSADPRVGGKFHAVMKGDQGTFTVRCQYRELVADQKIVFSHRWDEPGSEETLVTVTFSDREGGTEVVLVHDRLRDEQTARSHEQGWTQTLDSLATYFGA